MVLRIIFLGLFFAACNQRVEPVGEVENPGADLFEKRCAECHGMDGSANIAGALDLSKSRLSDAKIEKVILNGQKAMPPFKLLIDSDSLLIQLIEHVKTLRKP
ncbi:MAG: hypothetical protein A3D92_21810 [Bacteroidetes bacterium RIFCSPHIGHO2_02_FULL_44_7]|nr:MAG: hypothetical protein A3D92_21810 [Bacteroidetes bacterium RIFCSPHIGHO2_02_FULL_44_7]